MWGANEVVMSVGANALGMFSIPKVVVIEVRIVRALPAKVMTFVLLTWCAGEVGRVVGMADSSVGRGGERAVGVADSLNVSTGMAGG